MQKTDIVAHCSNGDSNAFPGDNYATLVSDRTT